MSHESSSEGISVETRRKVYERWKGKCAFCGVDLTVDEHHIISIKDDPSLKDDPDNMILLCGNHHGLTRKMKPDGVPAVSLEDIQDLKKSRFASATKSGFYFEIPQCFAISLGSNICARCPYILVVNRKPLIEIWPQQPSWYSKENRYYLYMRFFDDRNNFIGGMFANHWASVKDENWKLRIDENEISAENISKKIFVKFKKRGLLYITGHFYFDGIEIWAYDDRLVLPKCNEFRGCQISNFQVAFTIDGNSQGASLGIGGRLA